ncbi:MAG TPA: 5'-3' exonuclease H3TH domain-containing protein, partial [Ruania sp.]|nr:5'-3' exonuclease H3TH domain-containing protein [Ruania sp.]
MTDTARPRLLIIDGHSMAYRAFFALPAENFSTTTGQTTNAVYGFTSMLINLLRDEDPTHVAVAFDVSSHTFRKETYADYKGTRDETPEEFRGQIPLIEEVLAALGVTTLGKEGFEADDILATLAATGRRDGFDVLVCSGDRDTFQLVDDVVTVLYPRKGVSDLSRMTPQAVTDKYGVGPQQYSDLAALVGESSDNLPGVPGVGPKTAAKWIHAHGGLEGIVADAPSITGKAGASLRENLDQVLLNRQLNQLITDMELPVTLEDLARRPYERERVHEVFDALEFRVLRERLFAMDPQDTEAADAAAFDLDITTLAAGQAQTWLDAHASGEIGLDVAGSAAQGSGDAWALALAAQGGAVLSIDLAEITPEDEAALAAWLADPKAPKVLHEAKSAWHALDGRGLVLEGVVFDTAVAAYLCHPDQRSYSLADLSVRFIGRELRTEADSGAQQMLVLDGPGEAELGAIRAAAVLELAGSLREQLVDRHATDLLADLELPVAAVLARMEQAGIAADVDYLRELEQHFDAQVRSAAEQA